MNKEDIYKYFTLQTNIYQVLSKWLLNNIKKTNYQNIPYKIMKISLLDGGCITFIVKFLDGDLEIEESYKINIKELENI